MKLVLLPGNDARNQTWIREVRDSISDKFDGSYLQGYGHWGSGKTVIDLNTELQKLYASEAILSPYTIFAKSAGVLLSLKGMYDKMLMPQRCIFVGTPVHFAKQNRFPLESWITAYQVPTLFIQKSRDPAATFGFLKGYLEKRGVKNHTMVEMPGDDHDYKEIDELNRIINDYLKA